MKMISKRHVTSSHEFCGSVPTKTAIRARQRLFSPIVPAYDRDRRVNRGGEGEEKREKVGTPVLLQGG
jgi:hypothetical protein